MSYLGIGVNAAEPSLGYLLKDGQGVLFTLPWCAVFPGAWTKSRSRYFRNSPRTRRAKLGMNSTPKAPITLYFPGPVGIRERMGGTAL